MRTLWPLVTILLGSVACTKQQARSEFPRVDEPATTDNATPEAQSPEEGASVNPTETPAVTAPESPDPADIPTETPTESEPPAESPETTPPGKKFFTLSEEQYWTYTKDGSSLKFNSPWDKEEGDAIQKDYDSQPDFVKSCVESAKKNLEDEAKNESFATSVDKILQAGATDKLILLVNVVDQKKDRETLRRLDRDAYFWNWPEPGRRPYFAMANFKKGAFVWEIIASKETCILPAKSDVDRYLAYIEKRLTPTQGS